MDARTWLRVMAGAFSGPPNHKASAALAVFAARLTTEFPASAFTPDTARAVGKRFPSSEPPEYDQIAAQLRHHAPPTAPQDRGPAGDAVVRSWWRYAADRLAAGADRRLVLSMLRTYAPADELPRIMAQHFPAELDGERQYEAEKERDKARAAEQAAIELARAKAMPRPQSPSSAQPPPAPDTPQPRRVRELNDREVRLLREQLPNRLPPIQREPAE